MAKRINLAITIILIGLAYLFQQQIPVLIEWIRTLGYPAMVGFCCLYCIASLLFFPIMPIILAAGTLFGFYWGFILNLLSALISAYIAFLISRHIGFDWLPHQKKQYLNQWITRIESYGWKSLALCRLTPFLPCALVNYGYGLTRMRTSTFMITSFIFCIPYKLIETYCGYLGTYL